MVPEQQHPSLRSCWFLPPPHCAQVRERRVPHGVAESLGHFIGGLVRKSRRLLTDVTTQLRSQANSMLGRRDEYIQNADRILQQWQLRFRNLQHTVDDQKSLR